MKKTISLIAVLACIVQTAFAEAPELKNMMPNSWQKLTRLSEQEEKDFFTNKNVKEDLSYRQNYYNGKKNKEIDIKIYYEKCGSILFYRVLYCNENLNDFFNIEYKNCTITQEEYEYWQDIEMLQSLYIKGKKNDLKFIGGVGFHTYWASQDLL